MGSRQTPVPARGRAWCMAGVLLLVSSVAVGCGPSQDEIRADIDQACARLLRDLSELQTDPSFGQLAFAAGEAGYEYRIAAAGVRKISTEGPANDLAGALSALGASFRDLEQQLTWRDFESLVPTRQAGEEALADVVAAAESLGAAGCTTIGAPVEYFAIATDGAAAAAAAIAPTGDYVADADAACARFDDDTFAVIFKIGMRSIIADDAGTTSAGDYLEAIEDLGVLTKALDLLIDDLAELAPPAGLEASHEALVEGYRDAREALATLGDDDATDLLDAAVEQVEEAAGLLGVDCGL